MKARLRLLRPGHWLKNVLVLLPLVFSGQLFGKNGKLVSALIGFVAFCLFASAVYILNDLRDAEADRNHPSKRLRPIASGEVSPRSALLLMAVLLAITVLLGLLAHFPLMAWIYLILYLVLNLGYSFGLKQVPILDVALLVSGFLLRVLFGAKLTDIRISEWM